MNDDDARKIIVPLEQASREHYDAIQKDLRDEALAELGCLLIPVIVVLFLASVVAYVRWLLSFP